MFSIVFKKMENFSLNVFINKVFIKKISVSQLIMLQPKVMSNSLEGAPIRILHKYFVLLSFFVDHVATKSFVKLVRGGSD